MSCHCLLSPAPILWAAWAQGQCFELQDCCFLSSWEANAKSTFTAGLYMQAEQAFRFAPILTYGTVNDHPILKPASLHAWFLEAHLIAYVSVSLHMTTHIHSLLWNRGGGSRTGLLVGGVEESTSKKATEVELMLHDDPMWLHIKGETFTFPSLRSPLHWVVELAWQALVLPWCLCRNLGWAVGKLQILRHEPPHASWIQAEMRSGGRREATIEGGLELVTMINAWSSWQRSAMAYLNNVSPIPLVGRQILQTFAQERSWWTLLGEGRSALQPKPWS